MAIKQRLLITLDEAQDLYINRKYSINSIAKSKSVHPNLLRRNLIYLGFKIRNEKQKINAFDYRAEKYEQLEALALGIWLGEGTKIGKRVEVTNCNPLILRVWLSFLLKICNVDASKLKLRISLHNALLKEKAKNYWIENLDYEIVCSFSIKKTVPNCVPKQPMGTATLSYNSVNLIKIIQQRTVELASSLM
jgi:hypothetical protein